jgi:hypothetical protein
MHTVSNITWVRRRFGLGRHNALISDPIARPFLWCCTVQGAPISLKHHTITFECLIWVGCLRCSATAMVCYCPAAHRTTKHAHSSVKQGMLQCTRCTLLAIPSATASTPARRQLLLRCWQQLLLRAGVLAAFQRCCTWHGLGGAWFLSTRYTPTSSALFAHTYTNTFS